MTSFYEPIKWSVEDINKTLTISGDEHHHIVNVSRYRVGDTIVLNNGKGQLAYGKIVNINKKSTEFLLEKIDTLTNTKPEIAVAFSLLKNKNDHLIVEKLTEIGVKHFFPMETRYSVRKIVDSKNKDIDPNQDKMIKTAIAAIKQCDNVFLPNVYPVKSLEKTIIIAKELGFVPIVASEIEKDLTLTDLYVSLYPKPVCLFIGPEGGFHPEEHELFNREEIKTFTIGNHILRAETAAISASSIIAAYNLQKDPKYY